MRSEGETFVGLEQIAEQVPELEVAAMEVIERGWDWVVFDGEGWILRAARRPEVAARIAVEACLLDWLVDDVNLPVPRLERSGNDPAFMLYRRLPGVELDRASSDHLATAGRDVGTVLRNLHEQSVDRPRECGVQEDMTPTWISRFRSEVLPLLSSRLQGAGEKLLDSYPSAEVDVSLTHADVAGDHLLVDPASGRLTGVIDWSDAQIGDPALDLSWVLNKTPTSFREGFVHAYGIDDDLVARAAFYFRLTPWHDVLHGLDVERPETVKSGLGQVMARLPV